MKEPTTKYPWYKKINPLWWFGNANDPVTDPDNDAFCPGKPTWIRKLLWALRNPLHNFFAFVVGLDDQKAIVNFGNQWPRPGQKWNVILPFLCYKGTKWEWYIGWRNGTNLGAAFRRVSS